MAAEKEKSKVVRLFNSGGHLFRTSVGEFGPQGTIDIDTATEKGQQEVDLLLRHKGVFKADEYKAPAGETDALKARIAALEKENEELRKKLK